MKIFITGITGQDGAYLAKLLLDQGYEVHGGVRRNSTGSLWRLEALAIADRVKLHTMELMEITNLMELVREIRPKRIFNLAAQSFVGSSFKMPLYTGDVDGLAVTRFLEVIRIVDPEIRFYQASTSEMFGKAQETPQRETTPFYPRSPYGVAKLYGHWITVNYRESYGLHASSGILFNHESPLRGLEFVTRKITSQLAQIKHGQRAVLELGNMDAKRDWGYAADYVRGMAMMVEAEEPDDYVLATGHTHSVRHFVDVASQACGLQLAWEGEGEATRGIDRASGRAVVAINPQFYRPAEVDLLIGDPSKAKSKLGWSNETSFEQLVELMAKADLDRVSRGLPLL